MEYYNHKPQFLPSRDGPEPSPVPPTSPAPPEPSSSAKSPAFIETPAGKPEGRPKPQKDDDELDEINIIRYFFIIWKRKWSFVIIFIVIVAATVGIAMKLPAVFETNALIKIGSKQSLPIEQISDIRTIFSSPIIEEKIVQKITLEEAKNIEGLGKSFDLTLNAEEAAGFIVVKGRANSAEGAVQVTEAVSAVLVERHKELFEQAGKTQELDIEVIKREQEKTQKEIEQTKNKLALLEKDIADYQKEINKRADAQSEGQGRIAESYLTLLAATKTEKEERLTLLNNLEEKLKNFDVAFQKIEYEKTYETKMTSIEIPPTLPQNSIAPARRKIAVQAAIIAFFVALFYPFAAEFCSQHRRKRKNNLTV